MHQILPPAGRRPARQGWRRAVCLALMSISLASCASTSDIFPLNAAAKQIGEPKIKFVREGIGRGPVTATMPDGEKLTGHYIVGSNGFVGTSFSGAQVASAIGIGGGTVQFVLRGPKTEMLCQGSINVAGHGNGQCRTTDDARWAIDY
ncbi:MAG: hypothetical protein KGI94_12330 [Paracoccaceae bacterium]|nr:hypothetical protein [Paracoccaceae bacterium]